ncbi:hypothetical protein GYMLUDRAFT_247080 [Collybiopsis luxurians FD-317 M1]|uniref:Uncharacterized protein n=1 Tax=Collybiopsis luxurians FD-317 M1 TaxID=944289 RepID=A0A0D0CPY9_9AGAR|nr:hypothetical protein GYMLUDRAFT_247080 [Collybiopsis luxurians FD-317 M1]
MPIFSYIASLSSISERSLWRTDGHRSTHRPTTVRPHRLHGKLSHQLIPHILSRKSILLSVTPPPCPKRLALPTAPIKIRNQRTAPPFFFGLFKSCSYRDVAQIEEGRAFIEGMVEIYVTHLWLRDLLKTSLPMWKDKEAGGEEPTYSTIRATRFYEQTEALYVGHLRNPRVKPLLDIGAFFDGNNSLSPNEERLMDAYIRLRSPDLAMCPRRSVPALAYGVSREQVRDTRGMGGVDGCSCYFEQADHDETQPLLTHHSLKFIFSAPTSVQK